MDHQDLSAFIPPKLELLQQQTWIEEGQWGLVERLASVMWDGTTAESIIRAVHARQLTAYGLPQGLILLETIEWPKGRELSIYGMAGSGILKAAEPIVRDLKKIAHYWGCSMIGGVGVPKGWLKAAPALGFKLKSAHYVMEL